MRVVFDTNSVECDGGTIEIDGVKFSVELFRYFVVDAEAGSLFRFIKREDDVITVERVEQ